MSKEKKRSKYGILSIIIITVLGFIVPNFWRYKANELGNNPNYFHMGENLIDFANLTTYSAIIFGIANVVLTYILSIILRNHIIRTNIQKYPNENVLVYFFPNVTIILLVQFCIGSYFGQMIFPFFLSNEITHVDMVTRQSLLFYCLYGFAAIIFALLFEAYTVILTNKRLIGTFKWLGEKTVLIKDIKKIRKTFGGYEITSIDSSMFPLKYGTQAEKCGKKLEELIRQEKLK